MVGFFYGCDFLVINMHIMIKEIDFETIFPIWTEKLWPGRISPIETHSAMLHLFTEYDMGNFLLPVWYLGYYADNTLIGVNSGHMCVDASARSRGLWIAPEFRQNGYGKELLLSTIEKAKEHNATSVWSLPRKSSWPTYNSAGFILTSDWKQTETSEANAYCYLGL
jgi:N-acetylglutamate synthase-like GNAT family acetyltransferase